VVGIDGEEELKAEQLKNNSFEARRARNVQTLGSGAFNEDKDSLQNANRQILNNRATTQKTTVSNTRPSIERTQAPKSVQRNSVSDTRNRPLNNRPQPKNSTSSQRNTTATVEKIQNERKEKEKEAKTNKLIKALTACVISVALIISMYAVVIFGNIPFVTKWRNIWIETAMTTDQHKWLATCFFPKYLIDEVMNAQVDITDIGKTDINKEEKLPN
jgi:cation transport ATPase